MPRFKVRFGAALLVVFASAGLLFAPTTSFASTMQVTFDEPQFSAAPLHFNLVTPGGAYGPSIMVNGVALTGGVVLNESAFANQGTTAPNLYATFDSHFTLADGSLLPGVITGTLATVTTAISLDIIDGHSAASFTLTGYAANNSAVDSATIFLHAFNSSIPDPLSIGSASISGQSIAYFTVTSNQGAGLIDFGIDTVNITSVPEPTTFEMSWIGSGVCVFVVARCRRGVAMPTRSNGRRLSSIYPEHQPFTTHRGVLP
jgi:hypothetical protein